MKELYQRQNAVVFGSEQMVFCLSHFFLKQVLKEEDVMKTVGQWFLTVWRPRTHLKIYRAMVSERSGQILCMQFQEGLGVGTSAVRLRFMTNRLWANIEVADSFTDSLQHGVVFRRVVHSFSTTQSQSNR